jgi:hypothetical protein
LAEIGGCVGNAPELSVAHEHSDAKRKMSKKYALEVLVVVVLLGATTILPAVLQEQIVQSVYWKTGLVGLWLLAIIAFWIRGRILTKEDVEAERNREKQYTKMTETLERVMEAVVTQRAAITGTANITLPRLAITATGTVSTLADKAEGLARDLLKFLKEKGPVPEQPPLRKDNRTWNERWNHFWKQKKPFEERVDAGYSAHFAERVSKIRHEIQEYGIPTHKLDDLVDKGYHDSDTIREIIAMLLEMSVRIRTNELLGDG